MSHVWVTTSRRPHSFRQKTSRPAWRRVTQCEKLIEPSLFHLGAYEAEIDVLPAGSLVAMNRQHIRARFEGGFS